MKDNLFYVAAVVIVLMFGGLIGTNIVTTTIKGNLIKESLERGQNPIYVKCAMENDSSSECKMLITTIAISKSDK